jgi:ribosomal protein S18 acetylase RimI-like enzyme
MRRLYRTTRDAELAAMPWSEAQKSAFCDMQYDMQRASYAQTYPGAEWRVITTPDDEPAGRIITACDDQSMLLVDVALLPTFRGQGWGTLLLTSLQEDAQARGLPLFLSVEKANPAVRLYARLGFQVQSDDLFRFRMCWRPADQLAES